MDQAHASPSPLECPVRLRQRGVCEHALRKKQLDRFRHCGHVEIIVLSCVEFTGLRKWLLVVKKDKDL